MGLLHEMHGPLRDRGGGWELGRPDQLRQCKTPPPLVARLLIMMQPTTFALSRVVAVWTLPEPSWTAAAAFALVDVVIEVLVVGKAQGAFGTTERAISLTESLCDLSIEIGDPFFFTRA